jgi:hypothetical protein
VALYEEGKPGEVKLVLAYCLLPGEMVSRCGEVYSVEF